MQKKILPLDVLVNHLKMKIVVSTKTALQIAQLKVKKLQLMDNGEKFVF
jgi:hypothetical protein